MLSLNNLQNNQTRPLCSGKSGRGGKPAFIPRTRAEGGNDVLETDLVVLLNGGAAADRLVDLFGFGEMFLQSR
jgi:hypothetical protein